MACDALCEMLHGGFGDASARHHLSADVHQSVEEGAGSDDYGFCPEGDAPDGFHAYRLTVFNQ